MEKKLTPAQIEALAKEIRQFLLDNRLWVDVRIYFNGKAFSTDDGGSTYAYNDPTRLFVLEDVDPRSYFEYVGDILSMSFEGDLCGCLNYYNEYGAAFDNRITEGLTVIFKKSGLYFELGNHWNLTAYPL